MSLKISQISLKGIKLEKNIFSLLVLMLVGFYWLGDSITLAMYLSGCDIPINFLNMELKTFPAMIAFLLAIKGISAGIIILVSTVLSKRYPLWITGYSILFAFSGYGIALTFFNIALILGIFQEPDPEIISSMLYIIPVGVVVNTAMLLKPGIFKKKFFLVLTVLLLANAASGAVFTHEWKNETKHVMKWGDKIKVDNYEIEFWDFSKNASLFYIYYNSSKEQIILSTGDDWNSTREHDNLRIRLDNVSKEKASITTWVLTWGARNESIQRLFLDLEEKSHVEAGKSAAFKGNIKNNGSGMVKNVTLKLSSGYFTVEGKKTYSFSYASLYPNSTTAFSFSAYAPFSFGGDVSINISVEGWGSDIYYMNNITKSLRVRSLEFSKDAFPKYVVLNSDRSNITVFLYINNPTGEDAFAYIEDEFMNSTREWFLNVKKGESKTLKYEITPSQVGNITLPPAKAFVSAAGLNEVLYSNKSEVVVQGSMMYLKKSLENNTVRVDIKNIGDAAAFARVKDAVPHGVEVLDGSIEWSGILQPLACAVLEYSVAIKNGSLKRLPPAIAQYTDADQNRGVSESNSVAIPFPEAAHEIKNQTYNSSNSNATNVIINAAPYAAKQSGMALVGKHIPGFEIYIAMAALMMIILLRGRLTTT
ncbi:MAG: hypothetical protein Q8O41_04095 [Candidatus Methanoperedens sp.]|nr:hypothetical protein [Candidatus Methanoperedens sp.]